MTIELEMVVEFKGEILRQWATKPSAKPFRVFWESDDAEEYVELFEDWLSPDGRLPCPVCGELGQTAVDAWQLEQRGAKVLWTYWMKEDPPFGLPREREEAP